MSGSQLNELILLSHEAFLGVMLKVKHLKKVQHMEMGPKDVEGPGGRLHIQSRPSASFSLCWRLYIT